MITSAGTAPVPGVSNVIEALRWRAKHQAHRRAYTFLHGDDTDASHVTYAQLDLRARAIAVNLREQGATGERVLLLYPPGLEYVAGMFGCLYAGAIAVPAFPPRRGRYAARLDGIVADAEARFVLTTGRVAAALPESDGGAVAGLAQIVTDDLDGSTSAAWRPGGCPDDAVAFLQYTSGSTTRPKGVMVTHGNLAHNLSLISHGFELTEDDRAVFWLPSHHDMGLIGGVLGPAYLGLPTVLMAPSSFLQRPRRWLEAMAHYRGTVAGGPNFGYDLCVDKASPDRGEPLDLSSWRLAFCGAEPIRAETLDRFAAVFETWGFRRNAFYPCYGLAETTLIAAGGAGSGEPVTLAVDQDALERDEVVVSDTGAPTSRTLVGSGRNLPGMRLVIVDPESGEELPPGRVGEICVSGPSVAPGYWNSAESTAAAFEFRIPGHGARTFLRSGDLGFLHDDELFVTGRQKDLIIIRGRNYYPQDIEETVARCHPCLRHEGALGSGAGAAFSVTVDGEERLVVVHEVRREWLRNLDVEPVLDAVQDAVARDFELPLHGVALVRTFGIPVTSSGKVQRSRCREAYLDGTLEVIGDRVAPARRDSARGASWGAPAPGEASTPAEVVTCLITLVARESGIPPENVDIRRPFAAYGLSSLQAVEMTLELERRLGVQLPPTVPYDYPTIETLAEFLIRLRAGDPAPAGRNQTELRVRDPSADDGLIAVIGMGCRFPGADSPEAFWQLLAAGVDAVREAPADRRHLQEFFARHDTGADATPPRWGGFLDRVDEFDAAFFGINPREAASLDPQHRLLLEVAWEALENAGQTKDFLRGSNTGVVVGISSNDYGRIRSDLVGVDDPYVGTGNASSIAANRLSYVFDLRGPSLALDTACSSSLVAVHHACQLVRSGECDLALAGGVNVILSPTITASFAKAGFLAADGRCKAFDARADGYVRGEGAGMIVLKRLSRALAEGDAVLAVIRGSSVNNDGSTNGLTAPNRHAQECVLRAAYARAGVAPSEVQYIETHGTGTALGDPIEAEAISAVVAAGRAPGDRCTLGSVKTNIGHLEAAAGIAGVIKTVLALQHDAIPPSLHYREPNANIDFDRLALRVADSLRPWPRPGPALAGVSSFGFGGANAHVVLESAPSITSGSRGASAARPGRPHLLPLSAATPEALRALAASYREFLTADIHEASLADICYTASVRRTHHDHRVSFVASDAEGMRRSVEEFLREEPSRHWVAGRNRPHPPKRLVFVFSGQGTQWWGMGRGLLERDPVFRAAIEECDRSIRAQGDWSLWDELTAPEPASRLHRTEIAQPALFAVQVALAARWRKWGIVPDTVVGHSLGEVAAAHVAGVLSLDDAVRIVLHRGRLMSKAAGLGKMAMVQLSAADAHTLVASYPDRLSVAAENGPDATVLSGAPDALSAVLETLRTRGIPFRELPGDYAFHSVQMTCFQDELEAALKGLDLRPAAVPTVSTAGAPGNGGQAFDAGYWRRQIRNPVRFRPAIDRLIDDGYLWYLELGPHPVLTSAILRCLDARGRKGIVLSSLRREADEDTTLLASLGALHAHGYPVDWRCVYPAGGRPVPLPSYPWQRARYWWENADESPQVTLMPRHAGAHHPLLGARLEVAGLSGTTVWQGSLDGRRVPYLLEHRFGGRALFPGTAYAELALAAAEGLGHSRPALGNVTFKHPLFVSEKEARLIQCVVSSPDDGPATFAIFSRVRPASESAVPWTLHAQGELLVDPAGADPGRAPVDLDGIRSRCREHVTGPEHRRDFEARGFSYGAAFCGLLECVRNGNEALARIEVPDTVAADLEWYRIHPAVLDACVQALITTDGGTGRAFLPVGVDTVHVHEPGREPAWSWATAVPAPAGDRSELAGDVRLLDENGVVLAEARGLRVRYLDGPERSAATSDADDWLYRLRWDATPRQPGAADPAIGTWWIFSDRGGVGDRLAGALEAIGCRCVRVLPGPAFAHRAPDTYEIRPAQADDVRRLFAETAGNDGAGVVGAVHLWGLDAARPIPSGLAELEAGRDLGPGTVVNLVREMTKTRAASKHLWLVTSGAQALEDAADVSLAHSPTWGLGRTIQQEQPEIDCRLVDLDPASEVDEASSQLRSEILGPGDENQVGFRRGVRHAARLVRARPADGSYGLRFRADGTYLVTGGLGEVGREVARWMIDQGARHLVLLGRTGLPARSQWGGIDPQSRLGRQIATVQELEAQGAAVYVASVDVADDAQLGEFFETHRREGRPPLRGVVHAAGVLGDEIIAHLDAATMNAVFRAKVLGSWLLHRQVGEAELDFFVMFSSAASILGSAGQGSYAAANAFLDALAHHRQAHGQPALSVNWGPWAEIGMAARSGRERRLAGRGIGSIAPHRGLEMLGTQMGRASPQVAVIPIDWEQLFGFLAGRRIPLLACMAEERSTAGGADTVGGPPTGAGRTAVLAAPPEERQALMETMLSERLAAVAGFASAELDRDRPLDSLGVDSLVNVDLKLTLERDFGVVVPAVRLLDSPTIVQFASMLLDEIARTTEPTRFPVTEPSPGPARPARTEVIPLQPAGSAPALFFLHPGALDPRCYSTLLGYLDPDQPVYVLVPPGLEHFRSLDAPGRPVPIEQVADSCLDAIDATRPEGPLVLAGWSLGGVAAYEAAVRRHADGGEPPHLILVDSPCPPSAARPIDHDEAALVSMFASYLGARRGRSLRIPAEALPAMTLSDRLRVVLERATSDGVLEGGMDVRQVQSLFEIYRNGLRRGTEQLWGYQPNSYAGPVTYVKARDQTRAFEDLFPDAASAWKDCVVGTLDVRDVPGDHYSLFLEPFAARMAEVLMGTLASRIGSSGRRGLVEGRVDLRRTDGIRGP